MLRDESITTTTTEHVWNDNTVERHHEIDRALRSIASQRCTLDVEEARWLRAADDEDAWRKLGYIHGLEYLEDVFGYRPRTAKERLRVARELGELPQLEDALGAGELNYSVVRELSRVATPANIERWIEHARGKNLRDVEQMVSGRKKGDDPEDAPDPALIDHDVVLELDAASHALLRDLRKGLEDELGRTLDDKQLIAEVHARVFAPTLPSVSRGAEHASNADADADATADDASNAVAADARAARAAGPGHAPRRFTHYMTCRDCRRTWQDGAGIAMQVDAHVLERAECDGIACDDDRETRAEQTIPERIRRKVMQRDGWRCTFPGCRSSRHLEVHHLRHREHGGDNSPPNLTTLCDGHHGLHHDGTISITGHAPDALVFTRKNQVIGLAPDSAPPKRSKYAQTELLVLARAALTQAGFRAPIAKRAVELACAEVGTNADLTQLIKKALRHCG